MYKDTTRLKFALVFGTVLFSIGGFLLRSYQLKWELLYDGSLTQGAFVHRALPLICAFFLLGTAVTLRLFFGKLSGHSQCFSPSMVAALVQILSGVGLLGGNVYLMMAGREPYPDYIVISETLLTLTPWVGVLAGVCLILYGITSMGEKTPSPLFYMIVSLYLVLRLLICFQEWNTDPSVHHYGYQLLAVICSMLGSFQLAGFGFDKGHRRTSLFFALGAVLFCTITVADLMDSISECMVNLAFLLSMSASAVRLLFAVEPMQEEQK